MRYFIYIVNCLLVFIIPVAFIYTPYDVDISTASVSTSTKRLNSGDFIEVSNKDDSINEKKTCEEDLDTNENKESSKDVSKKQIVDNKEDNDNISNLNEDKLVPKVNNSSDVLNSYNGKMSGYGPDCKGCKGYLSSGRYVGDGNINYYDSKYGNIRILAGDRSLKFGTIVRVKNSKAGDFIGIVLDRGSSIGFDGQFLFDLLYSTEEEALKYTVSYNTTFEILRYGY